MLPTKKQVTIPEMLQKLDDLYVKEHELQEDTVVSLKELTQVQEDIEVLELMIMHKSNRLARENT